MNLILIYIRVNIKPCVFQCWWNVFLKWFGYFEFNMFKTFWWELIYLECLFFLFIFTAKLHFWTRKTLFLRRAHFIKPREARCLAEKAAVEAPLATPPTAMTLGTWSAGFLLGICRQTSWNARTCRNCSWSTAKSMVSVQTYSFYLFN